ncbi:MAG: molecular chaperone DnaJ, partial [Neisseriaceae bacterium]|nr:molecular chaperone DnaJ [Neisseriaceae bacterium]
LPISFTVAALGGEVEVPTLNGKAKTTIPAGTQTGRRLRLRGKGITGIRSPMQGDLYCHIVVETPVNLTERQKELLMEFEKISTGLERPQNPHQRSFMDKLKDLFD